jgi:hypothetical protein
MNAYYVESGMFERLLYFFWSWGDSLVLVVFDLVSNWILSSVDTLGIVFWFLGSLYVVELFRHATFAVKARAVHVIRFLAGCSLSLQKFDLVSGEVFSEIVEVLLDLDPECETVYDVCVALCHLVDRDGLHLSVPVVIREVGSRGR